MSKQFTDVVATAIRTFAEDRDLGGSTYVIDAEATLTGVVTEQVESTVASLRQAAHEYGLSESLVENALIEAGLVDAPAPAEPETLEQKVDRLLVQQNEQGAAIAALLAAAKANGIDPARYSA